MSVKCQSDDGPLRTETETEAYTETEYSGNPSPEAQDGSLSAPAESSKASKQEKAPTPEALAFIEWFCDLLEHTGSQRPTVTRRDVAAWAAAYDGLTRLDGHTDAQLRAASTYARKDPFYARGFWNPAQLRNKKGGLTFCQKILSIMGNAGIPTAPKEDIFTEPANWRERLKKAIPFADFSGQNWMDLGADIRIQVLNTRL